MTLYNVVPFARPGVWEVNDRAVKPSAAPKKAKRPLPTGRKSDDPPAVAFLRAVTPPGMHSVVIAIDPEKEAGEIGQITACAYTSESLDQVGAFIQEHCDQHHNIYWSINPTKGPQNKKPQKPDIVAMRWVHLDLDDPSPEALARVHQFPMPPTVIVRSGGGFNCYWALNTPIRANGNIEELEDVNRGMIVALNADKGTQNIDRILRVPGTTNWPTKAKKRRGRVPVEAELLEFNPHYTYSLDSFKKVGKAEFDKWEPTKTGDTHDSEPDDKHDKQDKDKTRSEDLLRKVSDAVRKGLEDDEIHALYDTHAHAMDQSDPARAVQRCIDKVRAQATNIIEKLNGENALIWVSGKFLVMWHKEFEKGLPRLSNITDAKAYWKKIQRGRSSPVDIWLGSDKRTEYSGFTFKPGTEDTGDKFNLFRGWGVEPDPDGDCSLFLAHLREVICNSDPDLYDYLIQWLANSIQTPMDKPGTAPTLRGGQNAGKGAIARYLGPIYGPHMQRVGSSEQLLGKYNAWLAGKIMVFGDEAAWPGDKHGRDKLKHLITEDIITVEEKHVPVFEIHNYARYIFATNHTHSTHAELDDRRHVPLVVSDAHTGDRPYWDALEAERKGRGPAALLHYLMNVDLTLDLRTTPKTDMLAEQKLHSLDDVGKFCRYIMLKEKHTFDLGFHSDAGERAVPLEWGEVISTDLLHKCYVAFCNQNRLPYPQSIDGLGSHLRKYFIMVKREVRKGEHERLKLPENWRGRVYALPTLKEARASFEKAMKQPVTWPDWKEQAK
jgi:hypothetical protein